MRDVALLIKNGPTRITVVEKSIRGYLCRYEVIYAGTVKKVNLTLSQQVTDDERTDYTVGCSTNSGCEQSFVDFFAEINKEEQHLRGKKIRVVVVGLFRSRDLIA